MKEFIAQHPDLFNWVLLPLLIYVSKVIEVTVGTIRLILLSRKEKKIAPMVAFVEVLIWIVTIALVLKYLTNAMAYIAYAAGFATGNYIGMVIEERIAIGNSLVRVITRKGAKKLIQTLKNEKYALTTVDAKGQKGQVSLIYIHLKRRGVKTLIRKIKQHNPRAFYSVQDVSIVKSKLMGHSKLAKTPISKRLWGKSK